MVDPSSSPSVPNDSIELQARRVTNRCQDLTLSSKHNHPMQKRCGGFYAQTKVISREIYSRIFPTKAAAKSS
jgi:hypothetical protein